MYEDKKKSIETEFGNINKELDIITQRRDFLLTRSVELRGQLQLLEQLGNESK